MITLTNFSCVPRTSRVHCNFEQDNGEGLPRFTIALKRIVLTGTLFVQFGESSYELMKMNVICYLKEISSESCESSNYPGK